MQGVLGIEKAVVEVPAPCVAHRGWQGAALRNRWGRRCRAVWVDGESLGALRTMTSRDAYLVPQKHLAGLGLTEAIDKNKADLSRMSGKKDLYLASVFHATAFEWDTEGNPFDQDIYGREELRSPKLFYADHPFIFLVRDTQSGSLLFIGRLVRPKGDKMRDEL